MTMDYPNSAKLTEPNVGSIRAAARGTEYSVSVVVSHSLKGLPLWHNPSNNRARRPFTRRNRTVFADEFSCTFIAGAQRNKFSRATLWPEAESIDETRSRNLQFTSFL